MELPLQLHLIRHKGQIVLNVEFEAQGIRDWCLGLCLLKECLVQTLIIKESGTKGKLEIERTDRKGDADRTQANFESEGTRLKITENDLDYLLHFFLKYYRDGWAEVDHIDLEALCTAECQDSSNTFKVPESAAPLSVEAARKRLGL
ncbi:MAG TPA: hypothetical protein VH280_18540 [Verrucomicrobiae bacterium]|jgi:hypothetical protein|nr:hypothetical protein [Verrucomicrobiae bacterium]